MMIFKEHLVIEWQKFAPGTSFFIPCVDQGAATRFIEKETKRLHLNVLYRWVVENGVMGLRVWRKDAILELSSGASSPFPKEPTPT